MSLTADASTEEGAESREETHVECDIGSLGDRVVGSSSNGKLKGDYEGEGVSVLRLKLLFEGR